MCAYIYIYKCRCLSCPSAHEVEHYPSCSKAATKRFEMALVLCIATIYMDYIYTYTYILLKTVCKEIYIYNYIYAH